jgi:hypothetical protein
MATMVSCSSVQREPGDPQRELGAINAEQFGHECRSYARISQQILTPDLGTFVVSPLSSWYNFACVGSGVLSPCGMGNILLSAREPKGLHSDEEAVAS